MFVTNKNVNGSPSTVADGSNVALGAKSDAPATWYNTVSSLLSKLALLIAVEVGAGSHVYGYTNNQLVTDAWTLLGTTRTKTFTYTGTNLTGETDWV